MPAHLPRLPMRRATPFLFVVVLCCCDIFFFHCAPAAEPANVPRAGEKITFESSVRLIFKSHCFHCHGEAGVVEGGLDLRLRRLAVEGGDSGSAIEPHDAQESYLLQRMVDGDMPPEEVTIRPTAEEIETVRKWINGGAKTARPEPNDPDELPRITPEERQHWAFRPIADPVPPMQVGNNRIRTPIDAFIAKRLHDQGRQFSREADKRTLIRRAYFDLIGLPPSPDAVRAFLADTSEGSYERLIDRLLQSPAYGIRWARHWLDVVGYSDSEGFNESDQERPFAYKYRDYVIESLNNNLPFDRFIHEQLAGDEMISSQLDDLSEQDQRLLIATGFLRTAPDGTGANPGDPVAAKNAVVAETIKIVSTALMGMSVGCAQCHDHRYDPILHEDYYRMRAVFEPALNWKDWKTPQQRRISLASPEYRERKQRVDRRVAEAQSEYDAREQQARELVFRRELKKIPAGKQELAIEAFELPADKRTQEHRSLLADYPNLKVGRGSALDLYLELFDEGRKIKAELAEMKSEIGKIRSELPPVDYIRGIVEDDSQIPVTYVFHRGDPTQPAEKVDAAGLTVLDHLVNVDLPHDDPQLGSTGRRLAFAKHLTDPNHPLTARVLVNRFWMHHMGRGLVSTPGEFGIQGEFPSHPDLLDYLARDFIDSGWDLKRFHRLVMTSTVYRQSSRRSDPAYDRANEFYSRQAVRRLEAETIRDAIVCVSGQLSSQGGGPAKRVNSTSEGETVVQSDVDVNGASCRSIYVQTRRSTPLAMLEVFDAPMAEPNCTIRTVSTVTPQSLLLMNSDVLVKQSSAFAKRLQREVGDEIEQQVIRAWEIALADVPSTEELDLATGFLRRQTEYFLEREKDGDTSTASQSHSAQEKSEAALQALASFCQVIMGSNQFLYVD